MSASPALASSQVSHRHKIGSMSGIRETLWQFYQELVKIALLALQVYDLSNDGKATSIQRVYEITDILAACTPAHGKPPPLLPRLAQNVSAKGKEKHIYASHFLRVLDSILQ